MNARESLLMRGENRWDERTRGHDPLFCSVTALLPAQERLCVYYWNEGYSHTLRICMPMELMYDID